VADFVSVVSWHTDQNEDFLPGSEYGLLANFLITFWASYTYIGFVQLRAT